MSFAVLVAHHLSPSIVAIGFALALVATLVAAEERDLRRTSAAAAERPHG